MDEEVKNVLRAWGLEDYIDVFKRNCITSISLPLLNESMIKDLFPLIGPRAIFTKNLELYKSSTCSVTNKGVHDETSSDSKEFIICTPTQTSPLPVKPPVTILLPETSNEIYCDLHSLLNSTLEGKGLLNLDKSVPLNNAARMSLVKIIGISILRDDPELIVRSPIYECWARAITSVFPAEKSSVYFYSKVVKSSRGIITRLAGKLPDKIHNLKRRYRVTGVMKRLRRIKKSP